MSKKNGVTVTDSKETNSDWPVPLTEQETIYLASLSESLLEGFNQLLKNEKIESNESFELTHQHIYLPFCSWLIKQKKDIPLVIGINGSQGSGKSTLTRILKYVLESGFDKTVACLSIDDLYKTREQRLQLAKTVHPLLQTRGVPGTHDTTLGINILTQLKSKQAKPVLIPVFDKAIDDRLDKSRWQPHHGECDFILFEGWCVGTTAEDEQSLKQDINELERNEDKDTSWRQYVNQQLKNDYAEMFSHIDIQLLLKIPDFRKVYEWRQLQEQKLETKTKAKATIDRQPGLMDKEQLKHFLMHYERLTRHTLNEMPDRCDVIFELGDDHMIKNVKARCE